MEAPTTFSLSTPPFYFIILVLLSGRGVSRQGTPTTPIIHCENPCHPLALFRRPSGRQPATVLQLTERCPSSVTTVYLSRCRWPLLRDTVPLPSDSTSRSMRTGLAGPSRFSSVYLFRGESRCRPVNRLGHVQLIVSPWPLQHARSQRNFLDPDLPLCTRVRDSSFDLQSFGLLGGCKKSIVGQSYCPRRG